MKKLREIMEPFYRKIRLKNIDLIKNKTFLITGASGLIGSNLVTYLDFLNEIKSTNITIIGIIRSGLKTWMTQSGKISYLDLDLSKKEINKKIKFDYIFHCATYGQPKKFIKYSIETVKLNTSVMLNLLDLAQKNKATFLCLSSSEVYGEADNLHIPTDESYYGNVNALSDRAIYAESKRLSETICYQYSKHMKVRIARVLIGYGPGVKYEDSRVIAEFIKKAQNDGVITMLDEGLAERTFCFIADTIEMLLNIAISGKELIYNVSGHQTVTIKQLAGFIAKINNASIEFPKKLRGIEGTPNRSKLSNQRYCKEFKKKSFVDLYAGLKITSSWFRNLSKQ